MSDKAIKKTEKMIQALRSLMSWVEADPEGELSRLNHSVMIKLNACLSTWKHFLEAVREQEQAAERGIWSQELEAAVNGFEEGAFAAVQEAREAIGAAGCELPPAGMSMRNVMRWRTLQRELRQKRVA